MQKQCFLNTLFSLFNVVMINKLAPWSADTRYTSRVRWLKRQVFKIVTCPCSAIPHAEFVIACFVLFSSFRRHCTDLRCFSPHFSPLYTGLLGLQSLLFLIFLCPLGSIFADSPLAKSTPSDGSTGCLNTFFYPKIVAC